MLIIFCLYCIFYMFNGMDRCIVFQSVAKLQKLFDYQECFLRFFYFFIPIIHIAASPNWCFWVFHKLHTKANEYLPLSSTKAHLANALEIPSQQYLRLDIL